jgi:hypothetical protein
MQLGDWLRIMVLSLSMIAVWVGVAVVATFYLPWLVVSCINLYFKGSK